MKQNVSAPTDKELQEGPVVTLTRPGFGNSVWSPHGFLYPIRFQDHVAQVLESHFDDWIGDELATVHGITVARPKTKPEVPKCPTCGASGDDSCVKKNGKPARKPHKDRP